MNTTNVENVELARQLNLSVRQVAEIQNAAVNKAGEAIKYHKDPTKDIPAGKHKVDMLVRITADFNKGKNYPQNIVAKANMHMVLLVAFSHMNNMTADKIAELVAEAAKIDADPKLSAEYAEKLNGIKGYADAAMAKIAKSTLTDCQGKLTGDVTVDIVEVYDQTYTAPEPVEPKPAKKAKSLLEA